MSHCIYSRSRAHGLRTAWARVMGSSGLLSPERLSRGECCDSILHHNASPSVSVSVSASSLLLLSPSL